MPDTKTELTICTIGHSTHSFEEFTGLLKLHDIKLLADIRTIPKSRRNPQFNSDALASDLKDAGISYRHIPGLGGLRRPKKDSPNSGWKKDTFRGFADHMQTEEFRMGLEGLIGMAREKTTVIMCAEAVPWRCHRSLVSDALAIRGIKVVHIISARSSREHVVTPWAEVNGLVITYPHPSSSP